MRRIDRNKGTPIHQQIKADLLEQIEAGLYESRVPNELDLARDYGVARTSVRRAMAALVAEGVLTRSPGRGTFVARSVQPALATIHFAMHHPLPGDPSPEPTDYPIVQDILIGVAEGARANGVRFDVLPVDFYERNLFVDRLHEMRADDGIIVVGYAPIMEAAAALGIPVVECYRLAPPVTGFHYVGYDFTAATAMGIRHLVSCGARDIAYLICQDTSRGGGAEKVRTARATAQECGTQLPPERVVCTSPEMGLSALQIEQYLKDHPVPDAFFCSKDDVAGGALTAAARVGLHVPGDVMILGYSDFPIASRTTPPLSTIRVPRHAMGQRAVETLIRVVRDRPSEPVCEVLEPELVLRETTRPVTASSAGLNERIAGNGPE